jgi:tRNA-splicing ligase RtcB (3'-phosphate/5'-hydroxy nucleic acid ligase)
LPDPFGDKDTFMPIKMELNKNAKNGVKPVKIFTKNIDNLAITQLKNLSQLSIIHSHIAAMPDVHAGRYPWLL